MAEILISSRRISKPPIEVATEEIDSCAVSSVAWTVYARYALVGAGIALTFVIAGYMAGATDLPGSQFDRAVVGLFGTAALVGAGFAVRRKYTVDVLRAGRPITLFQTDDHAFAHQVAAVINAMVAHPDHFAAGFRVDLQSGTIAQMEPAAG